MSEVKKKKRRASVAEADCVACGCCVKECPATVITIQEVTV